MSFNSHRVHLMLSQYNDQLTVDYSYRVPVQVLL